MAKKPTKRAATRAPKRDDGSMAEMARDVAVDEALDSLRRLTEGLG